jgi:hypothetical protein
MTAKHPDPDVEDGRNALRAGIHRAIKRGLSEPDSYDGLCEAEICLGDVLEEIRAAMNDAKEEWDD